MRVTRGLGVYVNDWANSVYCSCKTKIIDYDNSKNYQAPMLILDQDLSIGSTPSFFNQYKKSIDHSHRTIKCPFKIHMEQTRKIHHYSHKPRKPKTRSMNTQDDLHDHPSNPSTQQQQVNPVPGPSGRQNIGGRQDSEAARQDQEAVGPVLEAGGPVLEAGGPVPEAGAQVPEANTQRQPHQLGKGGKRTPRLGYRELAASTVDLLNVRLSDIKF
jgi:hypothetical protein